MKLVFDCFNFSLTKLTNFPFFLILRIVIANFLGMSANNFNHEMDNSQKENLEKVSTDNNNNTMEDKNKLNDDWLKLMKEEREKVEEEQKQNILNNPQYSNNQTDSSDSD